MDAVVSAFPVVQDLNRIVIVLLVVNAILTGLVILFAWQAAHYRDRLQDLEDPASADLEETPVAPNRMHAGLEFSASPLSDDKPIPAARNSRRTVWRPPTR